MYERIKSDEEYEAGIPDMVLTDFTEEYVNSPVKPIIANDMDIFTKEGQEDLNRLLMTKYTSGALSNVPRCECGATDGVEKLNQICPECGDVCIPQLNRPVVSLVWIRAPGDVKAFINPSVWHDLSRHMRSAKFDDLEWLTNPKYVPEGPQGIRISRMMKQGIGRGLNYFCENFEYVMRSYIDAWRVREEKPERTEFIEYCELLFANQNFVFSKWLPMPSRTGVVLEQNNNTKYLDKNIPVLRNALNIVVKADAKKNSLAYCESKTVKAIKEMVPFYMAYTMNTLGRKPGVFRKNWIGNKVPYTGRAVIISNHGPHRYDELEIPWTMAISLFRAHIYNLLMQENWTPKQINLLFIRSAKNYHPKMSQVIDKILELAGPEGVSCIMNRNPTLKKLSIQGHGITGVNRDPRINSIRLSDLIIKGYNADFDGDAMNIKLNVDGVERKALSPLKQYNSLLCTHVPRKISGDFNLPDAAARLATHFLLDGEKRKTS